MAKFICSKCGLCCRRISQAIAIFKLSGIPIEFPYSWDENGVCEKLKDNLCSIYENRPLICNIGKYCETYGIDKKWFYKENMKACKQIKLEAKL